MMSGFTPGWIEVTPVLSTWASAAAMWFAMMMVMMLPSVTPWLRGMVVVTGHQSQRPVFHAAAFGTGYGVVWLSFSAAAALLQLLLKGVIPDIGGTLSSPYAGGMLLLTGLYQLSHVRENCLTHCRSPMSYLLSYWRPGIWMSLRTGLLHGAFCVGCCWALMLVGLAAGVMNVAWMAFVTLVVAVEKLTPRGDTFARLMAWIYSVGGLALVVF